MNWIETGVTFLVMWLAGIVLNPMNFLAFQWDHLYVSITLLYIGFLMASNMLWIHAGLHYLFGHSDVFELWIAGGIGIALSVIAVYLMRNQVGIGAREWMTRMIPHHSSALTTSTQLLRNRNQELTDEQRELAQSILEDQKNEIQSMKRMLLLP